MAVKSEFSFDVFLSHSAKDKAVVRAVAERLRGDGLRVWFDEWEIKPGDSIPAKIEDGLERSRVLVLCMSGNAFGSEWAQLEAGTFRFPRKPAVAKLLPRPRWRGRVCTIYELERQNPQRSTGAARKTVHQGHTHPRRPRARLPGSRA